MMRIGANSELFGSAREGTRLNLGASVRRCSCAGRERRARSRLQQLEPLHMAAHTGDAALPEGSSCSPRRAACFVRGVTR